MGFKLIFGDNRRRQCFMFIGLLLQIVAYLMTKPDEQSLLSLVSGLSGVFAVVLCAERKFVYFYFAWVQLFTYIILAYQQKFYGEISENIFYAVTMIVGMFIWHKHKDLDEDDKVEPEKLSLKDHVFIGIVTIILTYVCYLRLLQSDDTQPFMDSITTIPAAMAQILMILRFREQWIYWLIIDVASIYMWYVAGNYCMVAQFIFWTANCIFGLYNWKSKE